MEELVKHIEDQIKDLKIVLESEMLSNDSINTIKEAIKDYEAQLKGYQEIYKYATTQKVGK